MSTREGLRYARNGDVHLAYRVLGEGERTVLLFTRAYVPMDMMFDEPRLARCLRRLSSFSRLIIFDRRGVGLSDPVVASAPPTQEQWMDDTLAVLDAAGASAATLVATGDTGPVGMLTAATHPEQASALVLINTTARFLADPDTDYAGVPPEFVRTGLEVSIADEPTFNDQPVDVLEFFAPSLVDDAAFRSWWEDAGHRGASPSTARALTSLLNETDVRDVLGLIGVPTVVLHRSGDRVFRVRQGRYLADRIPDAKYVELGGSDDLWWVGEVDQILDEIEEVVTGGRSAPDTDRVVATILFTDIVGSTEHVARLGDRRWRDLLADHDAMVRRQLERFDGRETKTLGDGFLATFDGPGRAIRCAAAIRDGAQQLGLQVRLGLHTGEVELVGDDIAGVAVHIAQRISALAASSEILTSRTVKDLVAGSGIAFEERATVELKGVPDRWQLYAVVN